MRKHDALVARLDKASVLKQEVENDLISRQQRRVEIEVYLDALADCGTMVTEFNSYLWNMVIDRMTVEPDGAMVFRFKDGREGVWR